MRTCTVEGCDRKHDARGLCKPHYNQANYPRGRYLIRCAWCDHEYMSSRPDGRYCSDACKGAGYTKQTSCPVPLTHASRLPYMAVAIRYADCAWCGHLYATQEAPRGSDRETCSRRCKIRRAHARRRAREQGAQGTFTWTQVMRLHLLFDRRCAYCDQPMQGDPEPDHVIPLSRGGHNSIGNILPSCPPCNSDKRDLTLSEWTADRARRGTTPRRTTWDALDARFIHLHAGIHADAA